MFANLADSGCCVVLQRFEACVKLIDQILTDTKGGNEHAVYVKALIERQQGVSSPASSLIALLQAIQAPQ